MSGGDQLSVLVVGIGNPDRGDDAVGPTVARRLRGRVPSGICDGPGCLDSFRGGIS